MELHPKLKTISAYQSSMTRRTLALDGLTLGRLTSRPRSQQLVPDSVPCADPILRATPPKSRPISSASGRRHRMAPSANNPQSCAVMKSYNAPTPPCAPSIYSYSWNRWKEWRTSLIPPLSPYRSCHARPVPPRSFLWKLVHNSAFAQLPYETWANRSSPHRNLVCRRLKS